MVSSSSRGIVKIAKTVHTMLNSISMTDNFCDSARRITDIIDIDIEMEESSTKPSVMDFVH